MNRKKILFVYAGMSSFIQRDLELLKKHFDVKPIDFIFTKKNLKSTLLSILSMIRGVFWSDLTFSWFASTNAYFSVLLSKLFGKKSIVIVGGFEVAKIPEIGYGGMLEPRFAHKVRFALEKADKVLTVDDDLKKDAIKNVGVTGENIQTVPLGFDYEKFKPTGKKEEWIITVSSGDGLERIPLKGLGTFVKSAALLPDVKFFVIGVQGRALEELKKTSPYNVEFIPPLTQEELIRFYQRSKVYCQLSLREAFGCALSEAMLCECVPVGTNVQGVKTVIGDTGFYVPYDDPIATAKAIEEALNSEKGKVARSRIKEQFPLERREKELMTVIDNLLD